MMWFVRLRRCRVLCTSLLVVAPRLSMAATALAADPQSAGLARSPSQAPARTAGQETTRTLAVLPFRNLSGDAADDWIGLGLAETISAGLGGHSTVAIAGRPRVLETLAGAGGTIDGTSQEEAARFARALGATWLVTGAYERTGDLVRAVSRLVDGESGAVIHAATVEGNLRSLFTLQEQILAALSETAPLAGERPVDVLGRGAVGRRDESPPTTGSLTLGGGAAGSGTAGSRPPGRGTGEPPTAPRAAGGRAAAAAGRATAQAIRVATPPLVDGRLDDEVWQTATRVTEFVQRNPVEGAPATEQTEVYIAHDSTNLYFGIHAHYSDPGLIRANRSDRDQLSRDDTISVYFDPFMDQQRAYVFSVNGYGVQGDSIIGGAGGGGGVPRGDSSWDALFQSAGRLVEDGWTAEMAIPFKSLRYPARGGAEAHRWGFQIARMIQSKNEAVVWAPVTRAIAGFMTQMGFLEGMTSLSTSRNLELLPTFTGVQFGALDRTSGTFREDDFRPEAGINVKYGVTSDLTGDFTFNPDFSQVESDQPQIEVNQRFPLFFSELRPFFLEGQEIFATRGDINLLHTRTIVDPRYGGKLTGKAGNVTIGVLVANDEAPGKADDHDDPAFGRTAQFLIGRLRYDMSGGSYLGAIVTDREFMDSYSRVGGLDGRFRVSLTDDVEFRVAQSSTRADDGQTLSGPVIDVGYSHNGRNLQFDVRHASVDPDFRTATGFVQRTDTRRTGGGVQYRWWPQGRVINWGPNIEYSRNYDFAGVLQDEAVMAGVNVQFARNIRFNVEGSRELERFGGIDFWKWRRQVFGQVGTSRRFSVGGGVGWGDQVRFSDEPFLGRSLAGRLFVTVLPFSRLQSSINVNFSRLTDPRTNTRVFDVKIVRALTTYQFTGRLLFRNILEYNTFDGTLDSNLLFTYRVNAGTVFFAGYDDHYQRGDRLDPALFPASGFRQTNRAIFTKLSYLFRY